MQALLPPRDLPVFILKITTFKKLPIIKPRTKKIIVKFRIIV
jgi:hypothetical protein